MNKNIISNWFLSGGGAISFEPEAEALFARMDIQPDATRKTLINITIRDLKLSGVWAKRDLYYFTAAHDQQAAELNWKSTSYNLTWTSARPTFTTDFGVRSVSSSFYRTGFIPFTNGVTTQLNDCSISSYMPEIGLSGSVLCGAFQSGPNRFFVYTPFESGIRSRGALGTTGYANFNNLNTKGYNIVNKTSTTNISFFKNYRSVSPTNAVTNSALPSVEMFLLSLNSAGTASTFQTSNVSFLGVGGRLTDQEALDENLIIGRYMYAVGAMRDLGYPVFDDTKFNDSITLATRTGYKERTPSSTYKIQTTSRHLGTRTQNLLLPNFPFFSYLKVNDGSTDQFINALNNNFELENNISLATGSKTVVITESLTSLPDANLDGTWLTDVGIEPTYPAPTFTIIEDPAPTERLIFLGDSITVGDASLYGHSGFAALFRINGRPTSILGYGFGSIFSFAGDGTKRALTVSQVAELSDGTVTNKLTIALGTNDYGLSLMTPTDAQAALSQFLIDLNADNPDLDIFVITPLIRGAEAVANGLGFILADYRTAITNAVSGKAYVTLINGLPILTLSDLDGSVHPNTAGHVKYYDSIKNTI